MASDESGVGPNPSPHRRNDAPRLENVDDVEQAAHASSSTRPLTWFEGLRQRFSFVQLEERRYKDIYDAIRKQREIDRTGYTEPHLRLAHLQSSETLNMAQYREFRLASRLVLIDLEIQIQELQDQLIGMLQNPTATENESTSSRPGRFRTDDVRKKLSELRSELRDYYEFVCKSDWMSRHKKPHETDIYSFLYVAWEEGCITKKDLEFLCNIPDLVSMEADATESFHDFVRNCISAVIAFRDNYGYNEDHQTGFTEVRKRRVMRKVQVDRYALAIELTLLLVLIVVPVGLFFLVDLSRGEAFGVYAFFVVVFTFLLARFASGYGTVLVGSAAYAAVLTVFLGNLAVNNFGPSVV